MEKQLPNLVETIVKDGGPFGALFVLIIILAFFYMKTKGITGFSPKTKNVSISRMDRLDNRLVVIEKQVGGLATNLNNKAEHSEIQHLEIALAKIETKQDADKQATQSIKASLTRIEDYMFRNGKGKMNG